MADVGKFNQPDHSGNPRYFIEFLDITDRIPAAADVRARSLLRMKIQPGACVLDVGCGLGTAVLEMAAAVGPTGSACGVDISETMIAEATARGKDRTNVEFSVAGACALPHTGSMFDAVRMERVLLYIPDREKALKEMMRVSKPGARVVVTDVDIDCTAIAAKNRALTRKMTSLIAEGFANPTSGRELPALMRAAGVENIEVDFLAVPTPYEFCVHATQGALRAAAEAGKTSTAEVDEWFRDLAELEGAGDFLQLWFFVMVSGTVPRS